MDFIAARAGRRGLTATEALALLRASSVDAELVAEVGALLAACDGARFSGGSGGDAGNRAVEASRLLERLAPRLRAAAWSR